MEHSSILLYFSQLIKKEQIKKLSAVKWLKATSMCDPTTWIFSLSGFWPQDLLELGFFDGALADNWDKAY